jgi:hypothetical protein
MWVKRQESTSAPGVKEVRLTLEGWAEALDEEHARLDNTITDPSLYYLVERTKTPYYIIRDVVSVALSYMPFYMDTLTVDDGIIDTFLPYFEINAERNRYESKLDILYRLISMTKCYIKPLAENHLSIVYPQTDDATDLTVYSYQLPQFYEFHERKNELLPNTVWVFCNDTEMTDYGSWPNLKTGTASDDDAVTRYGEIEIKEHYQAPTILTQVDADNRAEAILARIKSEESSQYMVMPHDCRIELYDKLALVDTR